VLKNYRKKNVWWPWVAKKVVNLKKDIWENILTTKFLYRKFLNKLFFFEIIKNSCTGKKNSRRGILQNMLYYILAIPPFFFWQKFLSEIFWRGILKKIPERKFFFFQISSPRFSKKNNLFRKFPLRKKFFSTREKGGTS